MSGTGILILVTLVLALLGVVELALHRHNLRRIRIRVHVNGTRGKSSVVRLIAAALREAGVTTCAKTTGTLARMILPDGTELPVYRPAGPNVIEQKRIVATAAAYGAEALVVECMALQPTLQALCELRLIQATHGVITNARPDHLDVMGPRAADVALALAGSAPVRGKLFTAEREHVGAFRDAARDRKSELVALGDADVAAVTEAEIAGFSYTEHRENVALALAVAQHLGVERTVALRGMQRARPDPGALTVHRLDFFGRDIWFVNAFAANDPVSTRRLWELALSRADRAETKIALFNCRADRPERSLQLGEAFPRWHPADHVVLMGSGTHVFARSLVRGGFESTRLVNVEEVRVEELFEHLISLVKRSAVIVGMGNIGGSGLSLVRYFANRARVEGA
jgi:poly-gamma-glutamate synthase PgsB/CapB